MWYFRWNFPEEVFFVGCCYFSFIVVGFARGLFFCWGFIVLSCG